MKRTITTIMKSAVLALLVLVSQSSVFAGNNPDVVSKAKKAVASSPDDWYVLASSADVCLEQHSNLSEVKGWIEKSLEIEKNAYTLEVMGDYYLENKEPVKAMEYYVLSLKEVNRNASELNPENQQVKIAKAVKMNKAK